MTSSPILALERIAFLLERARASTYKVQAFRRAADALRAIPDLPARARAGTLREIPGIGESTAAVVTDVVSTGRSVYLDVLEVDAAVPLAVGGEELLAKLHGDLHVHSDWSDGGSPIHVMAQTARMLGRDYMALTDHSPRLKVANGLTAQRLIRQLDVIAELNDTMAPFRILTGIEVDILDDGSLDQSGELLARVDVVVASVHSKLRMDSDAMTRRMLTAIANPNTDVLGHCTGRMVMGNGRPESTFEAELVFEACRSYDVAVEINCRPERQDPPSRLITMAEQTGCLFTLDTDSHAPGQLDWLQYGAARAVASDVPPERIITTWSLDRLTHWLGRGGA